MSDARSQQVVDELEELCGCYQPEPDINDLMPAMEHPPVDYADDKCSCPSDGVDGDTEGFDENEDDIYANSMKAVSVAISKVGVKMTWTSFHRYCVEEATSQPNLQDLLVNFGIRRSDLKKIVIVFVPRLLTKGRLRIQLNSWANRKNEKPEPYDHFFDGVMQRVGDRQQTFKFIADSFDKLAEEIEAAHGHPENVAYLQRIYENAVHAYAGVMPHSFELGGWLKAVTASQDAVEESLPRVAHLYVMRQIALAHGDHYANPEKELSFKQSAVGASLSILNAVGIGASAISKCDEDFSYLSREYSSGNITTDTLVSRACESTSDLMLAWVRRAFNDRIAHVTIMNRSFCRYFRDHFGVDIASRRFEVARGYASL